MTDIDKHMIYVTKQLMPIKLILTSNNTSYRVCLLERAYSALDSPFIEEGYIYIITLRPTGAEYQ